MPTKMTAVEEKADENGTRSTKTTRFTWARGLFTLYTTSEGKLGVSVSSGVFDYGDLSDLKLVVDAATKELDAFAAVADVAAEVAVSP